jgi:hypothetical protein
MRRYYNWQFAESRLSDTVISYNGRAHLVMHVSREQLLTLKDLSTGSGHVVDIEDEGVSHIRPKVGFVNVARGNAIYVKIMPERRWKQGIPIRQLPALPQHVLALSLNGVYISFRRCLRSKYVKAFHSCWAVGGGMLLYKGKVVGKASVDGIVEFDQGKVFLKEAFEEVVR